jgi:hypothetical protein
MEKSKKMIHLPNPPFKKKAIYQHYVALTNIFKQDTYHLFVRQPLI